MCLRVRVCGRDGDADQMSSRRTKADLTSDHVLVIFGEHPDLLYDIRAWNYLWRGQPCVDLPGGSKQVCEDRQLQSDTVVLHQSCSYVFQTPSGGGVFLTARFSFTHIFIFGDHKPEGFFLSQAGKGLQWEAKSCLT